jgi:uncharacterized protein involved in oxidation of intracellular sulfur
MLFVLNEAPYGGERCYNGLRLAHALHRHEPTAEIERVLMADAVTAAKAGQKPLEGYYSIEHMLSRVQAGKGAVSVGKLHGCGRSGPRARRAHEG